MRHGWKVTIEGQWRFGDLVLNCLNCGTTCGLTFHTEPDLAAVSASCPNGHVWNEPRVPGWAVRDLANRTLRARR